MGARKKTAVAAKKTAKKASGSVFRQLPDPIREALSIAANEIFVENIEAAVEDARDLLESGDLGVTYQGFHRGLTTPAQLAAALEHLAPWLTVKLLAGAITSVPPKLSVGEFAGDLHDSLLLTAAIDLAEGVLKLSLGKPLPSQLRPYEAALQNLAARLQKAIDDEDTSEQDLNEEILGG